ncbi:MAG: AMP-binding protein [Gammaproteobacteria bacterium]|nr:MAG: AMP-binding protein [Gammaproteobacteria bacterium]
METNSPETLRDLLDAIAGSDQRAAVVTLRADGSVHQVSRAELARRVFALAESLLAAGVRPAEPVILFAPNSAEWIIGCLGLVCAGAVPVPIDCQAGSRDLAKILADCDARRALTTAAGATALRASQQRELTIMLLEDLATVPAAPGQPGTTLALSGLLPRLRGEDTAALFYTSGTTGSPKGVPLSHRNLLSNVQALVATELSGPDDRVLLPLPLHHTYPFTCGLLASIATSAALVLPAGVTGPQLVAAIRGGGVTVLLGVPRLFGALLAAIEARVASSSTLVRAVFTRTLALTAKMPRSLRIGAGRLLFRRLHSEMGPTLRMLTSGGARLDPETAGRLEGIGWQVFSGYGLTETSPILTFNIGRHVRHESVGRPVPGVELRIAAAPGQDAGEVQARGPNIFAGYRNDAGATGQSFTSDGWFRTGDLGRFDAEGFLHLVGRSKEIIVLPGGKKIAPEDVEQCFAASSLIREAALLEHEGRLVALVVPDETGLRERGAARLGDMLREEIERISMQLPAYQRVTDYRLLHEPLPRTPIGKLQRFRLGALYAARHSEAAVADARQLTDTDRSLLASDLGARAWAWLQQRFAGKPLSLDASPQLDLGVDSLEWLTLTLEIRDRFGVALNQEAIARVLTVRDLLHELASAGSEPSQPAARAATGPAARGPLLAALGMVLLAADRLLMRLVFRVRVEGREHLPVSGPVLFAPNHASYLDPMAVAAALPWRLLRSTRWAGWSQFMFRNRRWRLLSRATGVFPVDPDREPAAAIMAARAVLREGQVLVWFPEGRRTLTGEIGRFLPGAGMVLLESGSVVVPVRIDGSFEALPWNRRWPRPVRITVRFGPPLTAAQLQAAGEGGSPAERIASALRAAVLRLGG